MYQSGLLGELTGGLAAPRCHGTSYGTDSTIWLWLEDIADEHNGRWPLSRFELAARHLGQFNGAYLTRKPLPIGPWLRREWLRRWVERVAPQVERCFEASEQGSLAYPLPSGLVAGLFDLQEERGRLLAAFERLPHTFCHLDAYKRSGQLRRALQALLEAETREVTRLLYQRTLEDLRRHRTFDQAQRPPTARSRECGVGRD